MNTKSIVRCGMIIAGIGFVNSAVGSNLASDNVTNYATWTGNEGSGFGSWSFTTSGGGGSYLGPSGLGFSSWALYSGGSGGSDLSSADRSFTGGPLVSGQTFSIELGHSNSIATGGEVGVQLMDGTNSRITVKFVGGGLSWLLNDGGSDFGISQSYAANTPLTFDFTYNGSSSYSFAFGSSSGSNFTATADISNLTGFRLFSNNQGAGENVGFNNVSVIPEPGSIILMSVTGAAFGLVAFLRCRKKI